ncbi:MAG: PIN domain-containing protein [Candidatus Gracilibacteria bacterium]
MKDTCYGLIVDTNFFISVVKTKETDFRKEIIEFLKDNKLSDKKVYFSTITYLELFKNKDKKTRKEYEKLLKEYGEINIDKNIAMNASNLSNAVEYFYDQKEIADADSIIGATAFSNQLWVITTNIKDFKAPLFSIKHTKVFIDKKRYIAIYVLEPNQDAMKAFLGNCQEYAYETTNREQRKIEEPKLATFKEIEELIKALEEVKERQRNN